VRFAGGPFVDDYVDHVTGRPQRVRAGTTVTLPPWGYQVLLRGR
jgi:hypothetical protein